MRAVSFRQLRKMLISHDPRFEFYKNKGKGSHRAIEHPDISGRRVAFPIPVHREGDDIKTPYLSKIMRNFKLPKGFFD